MHPVVVGITGASGAVYAIRLIEVLLAAGHDVFLSISPAGREVLRQELDLNIDLDHFRESHLLLTDADAIDDSKIDAIREQAGVSSEESNVLGSLGVPPGKLQYCHYRDFFSPPASGSCLTQGMVVCPCSGTSLSSIANGGAGNLIQRAAEVHLKERRRLILVPRESPLSLPHIDNMRRATEAGAVILPAAPGWYHGVASLRDLVDFVVARICDQLGISNALIPRWGDSR